MFCDLPRHYRWFWRQIGANSSLCDYFWHQIDASHCILITFVVQRFWVVCDVTQHFWSFWTSNRCKFIVIWSLSLFWVVLKFLTSNRWKSLYFDHFCSLAVLNGLRRNSTFLIVCTSNRCKFIVIWSRLEFCVALIVLTSNRCKSLYFDHFCSLALFWMFCDVTQHFRSVDVRSMQFIIIWSLL